MNRKSFLWLTLLAAVCHLSASAQDIITDNKGKSIFNMPTSLIAPKLTSTSGGIQFPLKRYDGKNYFYYEDNDPSKPKHYTVRESWSIFGNVTLISSTGNSLDLSKKPNITPHFEVGIGRTLDSIYTNVATLKDSYGTFSASIFVDYQHFNIYDTIAKVMPAGETKHWSPGVKVVYNVFKRQLGGLAFTGSYQRNVNTSALVSYQKVTSTFYSDPNIAGNGSVDGYIGPAKMANQFRFSMAVPIFCIPEFLIKGAQFMPAPYYFITTPDFGKVAHFAGITMNVLPSRIYHSPAKTFAITSAFSLGYNVLDSSNKSKQQYFFLSGTFSFGDLKPATDKQIGQPTAAH
jgi:hypothetical protein